MALIIGVVIVTAHPLWLSLLQESPSDGGNRSNGFWSCQTESRLWQRNICAPGTAACGPTEHAPSENRCQDSGDRR